MRLFSKKLLALNIIATILLIGGALFLLQLVRAQRVNQISTPPAPVVSAQAGSGSAITPATSISGMPDSIAIPSLGIAVHVIPGYYDAAAQQWTLTRDNAQYATPTPEPNNEAGNTFIYGHALSTIFGSLPKIQSNAQAIVQTANGHTFYYRLSAVKTVSPQDSQAVFAYSAKPTLTLQTCTGLFYQNRELFTFDLERTV